MIEHFLSDLSPSGEQGLEDKTLVAWLLLWGELGLADERLNDWLIAVR